MEAVLVVVHMLAATVWVGGTVALVFVAVPVAQKLEGEQRARALRGLGRRWRPLGWGALAVLVVTGAALASDHGIEGAFGWVVGVKALLVALMALLAYLHDFVWGPGLAVQIRSGERQTLRPRLVLVGRVTLVLTIVIPVLGVALARM